MNAARVFAVCLIAMCSCQSMAGLILQGNDPQHIALGTTFGNVGWLEATNSSGVTVPWGSAVLIDPSWAIIAKHETVDGSNVPFSSYTVGFGNNLFTNRGETLTSAEVYLHPDVNRDLALIHFSNPFTTVTPAVRFTGDVAIGNEGHTVGYGYQQYVNDSNFALTGDRRAGFDVVETNVAGPPNTFATRFNNSFQTNYRPLEMGARPYDSGGGFFLNGELAGVIQGGTVFNGFGTNSFYTRLDNTWINETIAAHTTAVPEPSSLLLVSLISPAVLRLRYRRSKSVK